MGRMEVLAMSSEADTERVSVKTYVPSYQKAQWQEHANRLEMSQSEFIRAMVQSGRRSLERDDLRTDPEGSNPGGNDLETTILDIVSNEPLSFDEIVAEVVNEIETGIEDALGKLRANDRVSQNPRGEYSRTNQGDE